MPGSLPLDRGRSVLILLIAIFTLATSAALPSAVQAQVRPQDRTVPRDEYFIALQGYYTGQYRNALKNFRNVANGGIRSTEGRWVDSICYHTMAGECYYQLGEPALALEQYESAIRIYLANRDWMLRIQFPETIGPSNSAARNRITWGATSRRSVIGNFPDTMSSFQGRLDNSNVVRQGGVVAQPSLYPLRVTEIVRCLGLALYRRAELMGPTAAHSPLTDEIVDVLSRRGAPANHWSQTWIEGFLGMAQSAAGKRAVAIAHLRRAIVTAGECDHSLTPLVLMQLGRLFIEEKQLDVAGGYFLEATFAGAQFGQADVVEEGFRQGLITHLASGKREVVPQLLLAAPWAKREGFEALEASLYVLASESYAYKGDTARAATLIEDARRLAIRKEMRTGSLGARLAYQTALVNFQKGSTGPGMTALDEALRFQQSASNRLLQVVLADNAFTSGTVSARVASDLYGEVLRDPTSADWVLDPMDTLAVQLSPLALPMERWFEVALARKEPELAMTISDRIRRRRFYSSLPLGGRLLALRWILEAPESALNDIALLQRKDLAAKFPKLAELAQLSQASRKELSLLPLAAADTGELMKQRKIIEQWAKVSASQESLLNEIAVRREPSELVFPPLRETKEIQATIPQRQLVLSFFITTKDVYTFIFTSDKYAMWRVDAPAKVNATMVKMLKDMGHFDGNQSVDGGQLKNAAWQTASAELMSMLVKNARGEFWDEYDELVIVPDGLLWYMPFEALAVKNEEGKVVPLISKIRIRYAPLNSLVLPDGRGRPGDVRSMVVTGRLFPRDDDAMAQGAFEELARVVPKSEALSINGAALPGPTMFSKSTWDRLIVLDDIDDPARGPFDWSPAQVDRGKPGGSLADWFPLPFGSPQEVILPGFHTPAEAAMKRKGTGDEMFLAVTGMMATGTRTILISRWRTGGQSSFDLVRDFVQELPHATAASAWQRAVLLLRDAPIDPHREPRVKLGAADDLMKYEHPFFWAGYMLIDTGSEPLRDVEKAEE